MTIEEVLAVVKNETGKDATAESRLDDLVADSLEFQNLILELSAHAGVDIPDEVVARLETVNHLYAAFLFQVDPASQQSGRG